MNRIGMIAAAALAAASLSTQAFDGRQGTHDRVDASQGHMSTVTRSVTPADRSAGPMTRDEVRAELRELQNEGLYQDIQEASPTPLDDMHRNQRLGVTQGSEQVSQSGIFHDDLTALADREDEAPVIVIERDATTSDSGTMPFDHPSVRDGAPSDHAPEVPAQ